MTQAISLNHFVGPILNQGPVNTCAQHAMVTIIDAQMRQSGDERGLYSVMQSYGDTRITMGTFNTDSGSNVDAMFANAKVKGLAYEPTWNYDYNKLYQAPTANVYAEAAENKLEHYEFIDTQTQWNVIADRFAGYLKEGKLPLLAVNVSWDFVNQTGPVSEQIGRWAWAEPGFGHALVLTAIDYAQQKYIVRDSNAVNYSGGGYKAIAFDQFNAGSGDLIGAWAITGFDGHDWIYTAQRKEVAEEYVAILHRAPDHSGQDWWAATLGPNYTPTDLANNLLNCAEELIKYPPSMANAQFVDAIYVNAYGRHADAGGLQFWAAAIDGGMSRGAFVVETVDICRAYVNGSNQQYDVEARYSRDLFNNKMTVAMRLGVAMEVNDLEILSAALDNVTADYQSVETVLAGMAQQLDYTY